MFGRWEEKKLPSFFSLIFLFIPLQPVYINLTWLLFDLKLQSHWPLLLRVSLVPPWAGDAVLALYSQDIWYLSGHLTYRIVIRAFMSLSPQQGCGFQVAEISLSTIFLPVIDSQIYVFKNLNNH